MTQLMLSQANAEDAPMLTQLIREGKAHWGYPVEWLNAWKDELTINREQIASWKVRKATFNGKLVGFFAIAPHEGDWWLQHLWLVVEQIGRGVGGELFRLAIAAARELGATRVRIEADPNAEGFYLHMGAKRDGERVSTVTGSTRIIPFLVYDVAEHRKSQRVVGECGIHSSRGASGPGEVVERGEKGKKQSGGAVTGHAKRLPRTGRDSPPNWEDMP
jgi:RimJ/RimL family protein N-acetyltransferase